MAPFATDFFRQISNLNLFATNMSEQEEVYIPIPHYPPFKLRSSLIDKDPVIWVHLLEAYIELFQLLTDENSPKLTVKAQQQLQVFLKVYLQETAEEKSHIFSLGAINPDIKSNTALLRAAVFAYIKYSSIVKANLTAESVWNFVTVYVEKNESTVRGLVDGTFKSKGNDNKKSGSISSIPFLHKHLEQKIVSGKFGVQDLNTLSQLLGQHTQSRTTKYNISGSGARSVTKNKGRASSSFAESFVTVQWVETIEKLYANGSSVHAETAKNVMILSLLSLPASKMSRVIVDLGINTVLGLSIFPLFGSIITSDAYKEMIPNLEERVPFLRDVELKKQEEEIEISDDSMNLLMELFPLLTINKTRNILKENNGDVEHVTNLLLENPDLVGSIPDDAPKAPKAPKAKSPVTVNKTEAARRGVYDDDKISKLDFSDTAVVFGKKEHEQKLTPEEIKKRTLQSALRILHEDDEDEPDDTYDDQEKTSGEAFEDKRPFESKLITEVSANERYLYFMMKTEGMDLFESKARRSPLRDDIKLKTGWSDDRVEMWFRMVAQLPRRLRVMEEDFLRTRPTKLTRAQERAISGNSGENDKHGKKNGPEKLDKLNSKANDKGNKEKSAQGDKAATARAQARKNKSKSTRANHSRKSGHSRKTRSETLGMQ